MKFKKIQVTFISIFCAMIIIPLLFIDATPGKISEKEKRVLQEFPALSDHPDFSAGGKLINFAWDFESWVKDRIGFREPVVDAYNAVKSLNKSERYAEGQYVYLRGKDGHNFFAHTAGWMIGKFQGEPLLSDGELIELAEGLNYIAGYLKERGIPMIVITCPDKDSVYPEYYPASIKRGPEPIPLDVVTNFLKKNVNCDVYNSKDALIAEKGKHEPFNKAAGDLSHYNSVGGLIEAQELARHLGNISMEEGDPLTFDDVNIEYDDDEIPSVSLKDDSYIHEVDETFFDNFPELTNPEHKNAFENTDARLPTALFMRDSYYLVFGVFTAKYFHRSVGIHSSNINNFKKYLDFYEPDVVVFEFAERETEGFAKNISNFYKSRALG